MQQTEFRTRPENDPIIRIRDLSFRYHASATKVIDNVSLDVNSGQIVLIAGHSGSGKSTLLRAINGLIPHQHGGDYSGSVTVDGLEVARTSMSELATKVGFVFQNPENQIFMFSVERDIAFGLENLGVAPDEIRKRVDWAMELLGITNLALKAPHELSDGQKQRVALAGVIAMRPKILILDEPTSLLDPFTAKVLINLVRDLCASFKMTVLIVEHRLDLVAKISDRMVVIDKGSVVLDGTPRTVFSNLDVSKYGVTEPTVVKLAKEISTRWQEIPIDPEELYPRLGQKVV